MKSFVLGSLLASCVFVAMGWASERSKSEASNSISRGVATVGTPLRVADLTLDRLTRIPFTLPVGIPVTVPFPSTYGLVVDQFQLTSLGNGGGGGYMSVSVNGVDWGWFTLGAALSIGPYAPPVVVRPGDSVTLTLIGGWNPPTMNVLMTGWQVYPGEV